MNRSMCNKKQHRGGFGGVRGVGGVGGGLAFLFSFLESPCIIPKGNLGIPQKNRARPSRLHFNHRPAPTLDGLPSTLYLQNPL